MSDLFSGIPVKNFETSLNWYKQLFGRPPDFFPHDTEAVWKIAEHQYVYIVESTEHAGHAILMQMVESLSPLIVAISERGLEFKSKEYFPNDICKITYQDLDGNKISFGGVQAKE